MVEVSITALSVLYSTLRSTGIKEHKGLRLVEKDGRFSLKLDAPVPGDRVIQHKSTPILIIDKGLEMKLGDMRVNVEYRAGIPDLVVRPESNQQCIPFR
ncbi:MAG: hypothetical protein JXA01_06325 [Dehalococcoidia bacterium]|nr:hypothetical protein [Dehalococcoidia bacterium]